MKTATTRILLAITMMLSFFFVSTAFTGKHKTKSTHYAFVVSTEWDKRYDEPGNNGYVDLTTEIVSFDCNKSDSSIKYQFLDHYKAQEENDNRSVAFNGNTTYAWIYDSYDEAVESRRNSMAKQNSKRKRTIYNFYVSCK